MENPCDGQEDQNDLADVRGQQEHDKLLDVGVNNTTLLHCRHDAAEIDVRQDHVRSAFGDLRAQNTHGHTDICFLECRRIINTITSHSSDDTLALKWLHNLDLVFRVSTDDRRSRIPSLTCVKHQNRTVMCPSLFPRLFLTPHSYNILTQAIGRASPVCIASASFNRVLHRFRVCAVLQLQPTCVRVVTWQSSSLVLLATVLPAAPFWNLSSARSFFCFTLWCRDGRLLRCGIGFELSISLQVRHLLPQMYCFSIDM